MGLFMTYNHWVTVQRSETQTTEDAGIMFLGITGNWVPSDAAAYTRRTEHSASVFLLVEGGVGENVIVGTIYPGNFIFSQLKEGEFCSKVLYRPLLATGQSDVTVNIWEQK
jgi:hypothetical protein